jgi:hypothetical protein
MSILDSLETTIKQIPWEARTDPLFTAYAVCLDERNLDGARRVLGLFQYGLVNEKTIHESNKLLQAYMDTGWKITASFDPKRVPGDKEIVIVYGNYPHSVECLPYSQRVCRHPIYFNDIAHTSVEYNTAWEAYERIYILTTESRIDRYYHLLLELCRVAAPLHRIHKYCGGFTAFTGNQSQDKYICASQNHADVATDFITNNYGMSIVLEDDFSFLSDTDHVHDALASFHGRCSAATGPYHDFYVCFLSYSKWGRIDDCDDLVCFNKQPCTTSSGYILQRSTAPIVRDCLAEGVAMMKYGHGPGIYCCDRYWCKYGPSEKLLCFKRKLGFQYVTHSDIVNHANIHFD